MNFNKEIQELVKQYNINSRANTMLYKDKDVAEMFKSLHNIDRFQFVMKCNQIAKELIPLITPYHNRLVVITEKSGKMTHGIIEHLPTRMYDNNTKETSNNVKFRTYSDDSEGIALWVNTGNKFSTHLYNAEDIQLENEYLEDLKNECELNSLENQSYEG
jgi:hypothetical protein